MRKKTLLFLSLLPVICLAILFTPLESLPGHKALHNYLIMRLTKVEDPSEVMHFPARVNTPIYVLGGSPESLEQRYKTAAQLYHQGISKKILLLSVPGITEYDLNLHRNLTNDEWSVKQLTEHRVKPEDIEPVSFKKEFFGTLSEARGLRELAIQRGYQSIILVTSRCHTKRTWITFSKIFENTNIHLVLRAANDPEGLRSLLYEYLKLVLYKNIVLPYQTTPGTLTSGVIRVTA